MRNQNEVDSVLHHRSVNPKIKLRLKANENIKKGRATEKERPFSNNPNTKLRCNNILIEKSDKLKINENFNRKLKINRDNINLNLNFNNNKENKIFKHNINNENNANNINHEPMKILIKKPDNFFKVNLNNIKNPQANNQLHFNKQQHNNNIIINGNKNIHLGFINSNLNKPKIISNQKLLPVIIDDKNKKENNNKENIKKIFLKPDINSNGDNINNNYNNSNNININLNHNNQKLINNDNNININNDHHNQHIINNNFNNNLVNHNLNNNINNINNNQVKVNASAKIKLKLFKVTDIKNQNKLIISNNNNPNYHKPQLLNNPSNPLGQIKIPNPNQNKNKNPNQNQNKIIKLKHIPSPNLNSFPIIQIKDFSILLNPNSNFRPTMEDFIDHNLTLYMDKRDHSKISYFGLFDGFGGDTVSSYLQKNMQKYLLTNIDIQLKSKTNPLNIDKILNDSMKQIDKFIIDNVEKSNECGSTATICLTYRDTIYVANVGNSSCYMIYKGKATKFCKDHDTKNKEEVERIKKMGGIILGNRIGGAINLTRAIGAGFYTDCGVISTPNLSKKSIEEGVDYYVVICSDGVWDVIDEEGLCKIVYESAGGDKGCKGVCERIVNGALEGYSNDNISCIVIRV